MAKLVEILARELKGWPDQYYQIFQDSEGCVHGTLQNFDLEDCDQEDLPFDPLTVAWDGVNAIVTRAEWQAAVDALKQKDTASSTAAMIDAGWIDPKPPVSPSLHVQVLGRGNRIPQWDGVGLPPVGAVCENVFPSGIWHEVIIIAHDDDMAVFRLNNHESLTYFGETKQHFRPIRTPEQIAAEERKEAIDKMVQFFMNYYGNPKGAEQYLLICRSLHDAGYRKQEPK